MLIVNTQSTVDTARINQLSLLLVVHLSFCLLAYLTVLNTTFWPFFFAGRAVFKVVWQRAYNNSYTKSRVKGKQLKTNLHVCCCMDRGVLMFIFFTFWCSKEYFLMCMMQIRVHLFQQNPILNVYVDISWCQLLLTTAFLDSIFSI